MKKIVNRAFTDSFKIEIAYIKETNEINVIGEGKGVIQGITVGDSGNDEETLKKCLNTFLDMNVLFEEPKEEAVTIDTFEDLEDYLNDNDWYVENDVNNQLIISSIPDIREESIYVDKGTTLEETIKNIRSECFRYDYESIDEDVEMWASYPISERNKMGAPSMQEIVEHYTKWQKELRNLSDLLANVKIQEEK